MTDGGAGGNTLYFGDCLQVMREDVASESVDLVYLDPPFNSKRLYNAFMGGAAWVAFNDTWRWAEAEADWHEVASHVDTAPVMEGLRTMLGEGAMLAYLAYMANRLVECRRALKPTGSIYLHCDPTASHYLKVLMDTLFGQRNFRREIIWNLQTASGFKSKVKGYIRGHDTLLYYTRGNEFTFNKQFLPHKDEYTARFRKTDSEGRRYRDDRSGGRRQYLDETEGVALTDVWSDVMSFQQHSTARERLGYPTQKPLALLDRIVRASSDAGDVVMDPFCGCGTTIHAAQAAGRRWIGIDVSVNACRIIERRLKSAFDALWEDIRFVGFPKTAEDARALADLDKFRFERWAAALIDGMEPNTVQRGDRGIDGRGRLALRRGQFVDVVSQVKGGGAGAPAVQAFAGAMRQAGADMGIFICFKDRITRGMRDAAASAGRFMGVPALQIYAIEDHFDGRAPVFPSAG